MAASRLQFNRHRQTAETLPVFTCDYTTACLSFSRHNCRVSLSNDTTVDALRSVTALVHSQFAGRSIFCYRRRRHVCLNYRLIC